jgi:hypothetical protein
MKKRFFGFMHCLHLRLWSSSYLNLS